MSLMETVRLPIEQGSRPNQIWMGLQRDTASGLDVFQFLNAGEAPVDQRRIGERPQMFRRLEFWGVGLEKQQVEVVWHTQALGAVPAGPIQDQHDLLLGSCPDVVSECRQLRREQGNADGGRQMKERASGGGMRKAHEVAPFVPMLDRSKRTLPVETPDVAQDRFEADALFVDSPQLDTRQRKCRRHLTQQGTQTRLERGLRHRVRLHVEWLEEACAQMS